MHTKISAFWNVALCHLIKTEPNLTKINMFEPHIILTLFTTTMCTSLVEQVCRCKALGFHLNHCQYNKRQNNNCCISTITTAT